MMNGGDQLNLNLNNLNNRIDDRAAVGSETGKVCPFSRSRSNSRLEEETAEKASSYFQQPPAVAATSASSSGTNKNVSFTIANGDNYSDGDDDEDLPSSGVCPLSLTRPNPVLSSSDPKNSTNITYNGYLQLDTLLNACRPLSFESKSGDPPVHDEHLFIITHQAFELWFKQILFELNSIRAVFSSAYVNERESLQIVTRLQRIVAILRVCVSQFEILETMTPLDFLEFRMVLKQASGFQSVQFRLLENLLGVLSDNRINYAKRNYKEMLQSDEHFKTVADSERELSLFDLIENWLERTPGAFDQKYWLLFQQGAQQWIFDTFVIPCEREQNEEAKQELVAEMNKQKAVFERIFDPELFESLRKRGEFRMSRNAFLGALFIWLWRGEPRFTQPYQVLSLLMDIDSLMTKFRYAHVTMVHRMLGAKTGTGGSSGYQYLRSTISDRYKVFTDVFNLSTYIIPRAYLPPLAVNTRRRLSTWNMFTTPVRMRSGDSTDDNAATGTHNYQQLEDQENTLISRIADMMA